MGHAAGDVHARVSDVDDALDVTPHRGAALAGVAIAQLVESQSLDAAAPEKHLADHRVLFAELLAIELAVGQVIVEEVFPTAGRMKAFADELLVAERDRHEMRRHRPRPLHVGKPTRTGELEILLVAMMLDEIAEGGLQAAAFHVAEAVVENVVA